MVGKFKKKKNALNDKKPKREKRSNMVNNY